MATGDTEFLRLALHLAADLGVEPVALVHALQNHDEMTYELVHFAAVHGAEPFTFRGEQVLGGDLAQLIRAELTDRLTGEAGPYNSTFTQNGIASTTATIIAASLGYTEIDNLSVDQVEAIKDAHLLLAMFNAWQPGVFALSGWDLVGALTLDRKQVAALLASGDTRWIHRSAYDLMDFRPDATESTSKMPRGTSLYGTLPDQLADPRSFVSRLAGILRVRSQFGLATGTQLDVPQVSNRAMLVMVHQLDIGRQITVLNFAAQPISGTVRSEHLPPGSVVVDMTTGIQVGEVDDLHSFAISLDPHEGLTLLVGEPPERN